MAGASMSTSRCVVTNAREKEAVLVFFRSRTMATFFKVASSGSKLSGALTMRTSFWSLRFSFPNTEGITFSYHNGEWCVPERHEQPVGVLVPNTLLNDRAGCQGKVRIRGRLREKAWRKRRR